MPSRAHNGGDVPFRSTIMTDKAQKPDGASSGTGEQSGEQGGESGESKPRSSIVRFKTLRTYLLAGIVVAAPFVLTVWLTITVIDLIDTWVEDFAAWVIALMPRDWRPAATPSFTVPGIGLVIVLLSLIFLGAFSVNVIGRWFLRLGERIVSRMPVVRNIYSAIKQIFETVVAQSNQSFQEVALVEYPRRGIWAVAFVTGATKGEIQARADDEMVSLFLPTTPNPTSGFLLFAPKKDVIILDMTVEEGAKMVISGGLVAPDYAGPDMPLKPGLNAGDVHHPENPCAAIERHMHERAAREGGEPPGETTVPLPPIAKGKGSAPKAE